MGTNIFCFVQFLLFASSCLSGNVLDMKIGKFLELLNPDDFIDVHKIYSYVSATGCFVLVQY